MIRRSKGASSLDRFQKWKQSKLIDINIIKSSLEYCYRLAKRGRSSGLVIYVQDSFELADQVLSNLQYKELEVLEYNPGELIFKNGATIKVFTSDQKTLVKSSLGQNAEIVMADSGDPRAERAEKILNF